MYECIYIYIYFTYILLYFTIYFIYIYIYIYINIHVASFQFYNGIRLKISPTFLEVFLRHLSSCRRKAFHED